MNIYPTFPFVNFRFSLTLNIPLVVCRSPALLNIEPSTGWLQISAPAFLVVSSFPIQLKLNLPLVVCRFPIQLYIKPSTGCLQISASAIHWTYYKGVQNLKNEILYTLLKSGFQKVVSNCFLILLLNLPLIVCLRPFRLQISASAKHRTLHCSSTDYYACNIWFIICLWDSHFHIAIASLVLNLRKILWFFFIPPYLTQKTLFGMDMALSRCGPTHPVPGSWFYYDFFWYFYLITKSL